MLGVHHLAAAQLGLAQAQHRRPELGDHGVITVDLGLEVTVDSRFSSPGSTRWWEASPSRATRSVRTAG